MRVRDILDQKGSKILDVGPEETVFEAISKMAEYNVGALVVTKNGKLQGIISERDYRNKVILKGRTSKDTPVKDIMTSKVVCVSPDHSLDNCLALMSDKKIRHLPVLEDDELCGVISIGDLVKAVIDQQKLEIDDLKNYISGGYPG